MFNRIFAVVTLIACTGTCLAQSDLVMYDAEGDRVGVFAFQNVGAPEADSQFWVTTHDGYQFGVRPKSGAFVPSFNVFPLYPTETCTGPAYVSTDGIGEALGDRGGYIVRTNLGEPVFLKIPWGASQEEQIDLSILSLGVPGACTPTVHTQSRAVPVTVVDPASYNIELQPNDGGQPYWGFKPPIVGVVERPDAMFCNGFESCPTESLCGNGVIDTGEQCDDGNTTSEDGCSAECKTELPPSTCIADSLEPSDASNPAVVEENFWYDDLTLCSEEDVYVTEYLLGSYTFCLSFLHADGNIDNMIYSDPELTQIVGGSQSTSDNERVYISGLNGSYYFKVFMNTTGDTAYGMYLLNGEVACP